MTKNYKFRNSERVYFVSFAVVYWLDVFLKDEYKQILLDNLKYCQQRKGMKIYAWCIMNNHVHLVFKTAPPHKPELVLGGFKSYTARLLIQAIENNPLEDRKEYLLNRF